MSDAQCGPEGGSFGRKGSPRRHRHSEVLPALSRPITTTVGGRTWPDHAACIMRLRISSTRCVPRKLDAPQQQCKAFRYPARVHQAVLKMQQLGEKGRNGTVGPQQQNSFMATVIAMGYCDHHQRGPGRVHPAVAPAAAPHAALLIPLFSMHTGQP